MKRSKQGQLLDSFHLLHIVCYLQKGGGGNIEKSVSFKIWREMGGQTEFFYSNVEILFHHRPN